MKKLLLITLTLLPFITNAQGPGGVGLPAVWLKADAGLSPTTNNTAITGWVNQGSIPFTLTPGPDAPVYQSTDKPSVYFSANTKFLKYTQTDTELSSVLGDGLTSHKYDVFIVATGSSSGALIYLGPSTPALTGAEPSSLDHAGFGKRAIYYNRNTPEIGAYSDGEIGYYSPTAVTNTVREAYTPNVPNNSIPAELTISNIGSHPNVAYNDLNSLVFSVNGFGAVKQTDGITAAAGSGSNNYYGMEKSYSFGNTSNTYDKLNVSTILLGGMIDPASATVLKRQFVGNYYEIIVFNRKLNTEERQKVYSYLAAKYGIYLAHDQGAYTTPAPALGNAAGNGETVNNGTFFGSDGTIFLKRDSYNYTDNTDYQGGAATDFRKDTYYPLKTTGTNDNFYFIGRDDNAGLDSRWNFYKGNLYFEKGTKGTAWTNDKSFVSLTTNNKDLNYNNVNDAANPFPAGPGANIKGRMNRTWKLTNTGTSNENITFTLSASAFVTNSGANVNNTYLLISSDPNFTSGNTTAIKATNVASGFIYFAGRNINTITGAAATGTSIIKYLTVAVAQNESTGILPVTLSSFTAKTKGNTVNLNWSTLSEKNASHFNITRSTDGVHFAQIGKVNAAGNSNEAKNYAYTDYSPNTGINYYQLQQIDDDGTANPSEVVTAKLALAAVELVLKEIAEDKVIVTLKGTNSTTGSITATNILGQKITSAAIDLSKGNGDITINTGAAKGLLVLTLRTAEGTISKKIIK